jgi:hypothetical protein
VTTGSAFFEAQIVPEHPPTMQSASLTHSASEPGTPVQAIRNISKPPMNKSCFITEVLTYSFKNLLEIDTNQKHYKPKIRIYDL